MNAARDVSAGRRDGVVLVSACGTRASRAGQGAAVVSRPRDVFTGRDESALVNARVTSPRQDGDGSRERRRGTFADRAGRPLMNTLTTSPRTRKEGLA